MFASALALEKSSCSVALLTIAPLPRALACVTSSTPAPIVVPPPYVFASRSVNVPAPVLLKLPLPLIKPLNVESMLLLTVSAALPRVTLPAPDKLFAC